MVIQEVEDDDDDDEAEEEQQQQQHQASAAQTANTSSAATAPSRAPPAAVSAAKDRGATQFSAGQYGEALNCYEQALSLLEAADGGVAAYREVHVALLNNRAACRLQLGDDRACCDDCDQVLSMEPENVKALLRRAMANEHRERYVKALADFQAAARIVPGMPQALEGVSRMSKMLRSLEGDDFIRRQLQEAEEAQQQEQQRQQQEKQQQEPQQPQQPPPPQQQQQTAAREKTQSGTSVATKASAVPAVGKPAREAREQYEKFKQQGNAHVQAGRFQDAVKAYQQCIALDPANMAAFNNRSLCWLKMREYGRAEADATLVLHQEPDNVKALYRRGMARKGQEDWSGALQDFSRALELDPNNGPAAQERAAVEPKARAASQAAGVSEKAGAADKTRPTQALTKEERDRQAQTLSAAIDMAGAAAELMDLSKQAEVSSVAVHAANDTVES